MDFEQSPDHFVGTARVGGRSAPKKAPVPVKIIVAGGFGVGKTTTIGKLAQRIKAEGNDVLICAADTFRAAASDQLGPRRGASQWI